MKIIVFLTTMKATAVFVFPPRRPSERKEALPQHGWEEAVWSGAKEERRSTEGDGCGELLRGHHGTAPHAHTRQQAASILQ